MLKINDPSSQNNPNILCIIDTIGMGGGAEQLLASLVPIMRDKGANIEIAALFDWPINYADQLRSAGIIVHELKLASERSFAPAYFALRKLVRSRRYDVFWGHLWFGNWAAHICQKISQTSVNVMTLHSEGYSELTKLGLKAKIRIQIERNFLSEATKVIGVSTAVAHEYKSFFGLKNVEVAYNGVNCDALKSMAYGKNSAIIRENFHIPLDDFLLITPSRYIPKKGHLYLFQALKILREKHDFKPKLICCGERPPADHSDQLVFQDGIEDQVQIHNVIDHAILFPLIAAANAVVMPSLREPFGIAAAEAMILATPCILTAVDGFKELAGDAALLVPPANPEAIADAILKLRDNPKFASELGLAGQRRVQDNFDISVCANRWNEILRSAHHSHLRDNP